jgi:hypothetical protein
MDYRCEDRKKASWEATMVPLASSQIPLLKNADHHPQKTKRLATRCFQDTTFEPGFDIVKFLTRSWCLTSLIICEIDTTRGFLISSLIKWVILPSSYYKIDTCFTAGERIETPSDHLWLDSAPNLRPLVSRWEINKFENCWYKNVRILEVLLFKFVKFPTRYEWFKIRVTVH